MGRIFRLYFTVVEELLVCVFELLKGAGSESNH